MWMSVQVRVKEESIEGGRWIQKCDLGVRQVGGCSGWMERRMDKDGWMDGWMDGIDALQRCSIV